MLKTQHRELDRPPPQGATAARFRGAENSMGCHTPQDRAHILHEAIHHARQGQREAERATRQEESPAA